MQKHKGTNYMWKNRYIVFIKQCSHSNWNVHSWEEFVHYGCSFVNQKLQVSDTSAIQQLADLCRAVQSSHLPKSKDLQLTKGLRRVWIQTVVVLTPGTWSCLCVKSEVLIVNVLLYHSNTSLITIVHLCCCYIHI